MTKAQSHKLKRVHNRLMRRAKKRELAATAKLAPCDYPDKVAKRQALRELFAKAGFTVKPD